MAPISIEGLTKNFRKTTAVDDLSFEVASGTVTGFVGPNGAGKTTTMRCLLGLVHPTEGTALVNGKRYVELTDPIRSVGVVLEGSAFYPGRTGRDHLRAFARPARIADRRIDEVLELVGLADYANKRTKTYSMGMRQRLAIGAALLGEPEVLVLDEPANGLDPAGIRWMREMLRYHASQGGTVLVSSHVLAEVALAADEVVILDKGRLVKIAPIGELTSGAVIRTRVRSPQVDRLASLLRDAEIDVELTDDLLLVHASPERVGQLAADNSIPLHELVRETATLEDVFLEMTGGLQGGRAL